MRIGVHINGQRQQLEVNPGDMLLPVLRAAGYFSVKHGCESGDCGACAVLVNGEPRLACIFPAAKADTLGVTTLEALGHFEALHPLQSAFLDRGAVQCGYCTPGMLLVAEALLRRDPRPSEEAVRDALAGVLCRCTGYVKPVQAIQAAAEIASPAGSAGLDPEAPRAGGR